MHLGSHGFGASFYKVKVKVNVKVKQTRYRPGVTQRVPGS
jgi:hypothetical protein